MIRIVIACASFTLTTPEILGQTLNTRYAFGALSDQVGVHPAAPLLAAPDGLLYGSTSEPFGAGIVRGALFKISTNGSRLTVIKQFTNSLDGSGPQGRLLLDGDTLFGLTTREGAFGGGTVFRVKTNGNDFSVLLSLPAGSFNATNKFADNYAPIGGLTIDQSTLFGATPAGGKSNYGTIFRINKDGSDYRVQKEFFGNDGARPCADLALLGTTLFGTTSYADSNYGTIFRINTDGTDFTVLKQFERDHSATEGANPYGGLVVADGTLYGTTVGGGNDAWRGVIFKMNTNGSDYHVLHSIEPLVYSLGRGPVGTLVLSGDQLYGVTRGYDDLAPGASVFRIKTDGTEFSRMGWILGYARAGVTLVNGVLFGTAYSTDLIENNNALGHIYSVNGAPRGTMLHAFGYSAGGGINSITQTGDYLYGTTGVGGSASGGTIFRVKTSGTDFTTLFSFPSGTDGESPNSRLAIDGTNIFGLARASEYQALIYRIGLDGRNYRVLRRFDNGPRYSDFGERPSFQSGPVLFNGHLYGTISGTVGFDGGTFRMNLDGTDYHLLSTMAAGELTTAGDAIYAMAGGYNAAKLIRISATDDVTVIHDIANAFSPLPGRFAVVGETVFGLVDVKRGDGGAELHIFKSGLSGGDFSLLDPPQIPGDASISSFVTDGQFIYGVAQASDGFHAGAIFRLSTNGTNATLIYEFPSEHGNVRLDSELIVENNVLFGSTYTGGDAGQGTIFRLDLRPRLKITQTSTGAMLSWPAYALGSVLEMTTDLGIWTPVAGSELTNETSLQATNVSSFFRLRNQDQP